jgi:hypothetical protein
MQAGKETEGMKHGQKRNTIARAHGFRKFVTTNIIRAKVSAEAREMLLGHSIGLSKAYYKPGEEEILQEYLKREAIAEAQVNSFIKNIVQG